MITRSKQNWKIGEKVRIGFMKDMEVISFKAIKDMLPDIYTLKSPSGKMYEFIPHNGLYAI